MMLLKNQHIVHKTTLFCKIFWHIVGSSSYIAMVLSSFDDLLNVDTRIDQINLERDALAVQLSSARNKLEKSWKQNSGNGSDKTQFEAIANDISANATSLSDVVTLREKYGDLQVLLQLQNLFEDQERADNNLERLQNLETEINELCELESSKLSIDKLKELHSELQSTKFGVEKSQFAKDIYSKFEEKLVARKAQELVEKFNAFLLEHKWDTPMFAPLSTQSMTSLRDQSATLYQLSQLYVVGEKPSILWNFKSIANNFTVRFTYHFHDVSFKIETYFKFLKEYLGENMHKCTSIFHDEDNGLTRQLVHEQFINYVLQPIRDRINTILFQNDQSTLITLISQIISTDKELSHSFHYHGEGLASLVPPRIWDKWLNYEVHVAMTQLTKIVSDPSNLDKSASEFVKLINKMYEYLEPFYSLESGEILQKYKLLTCSQIFMRLLSSYLDFVLKVDIIADRLPEEQLYQTFIKLQNCNVVSRRISELSLEYIFVHLTDIVNQRENKNYDSILQNVQESYQQIIENGNQGTIVHRIQKLLKESLKNYFKSGNWCLQNGPLDGDSPSSELVNSIKLMTRIMTKLDSLLIPLEVALDIKSQLLNVIVNYFIESILKLNKFNREGLEQLKVDFYALKASLNLPETVCNSQVAVLTEIVKILYLKYDDSSEMFIDTSYIKERDYTKLRSYHGIKLLRDSEIQDALYRVAYGNVV
ncbi:ZYRO0F07854p [Zygosaccharomyces rouxii]|uniref:ZYRO0F07854p n=1 Tax=Zygosaccharomyces rouxii (strain ATCC 2623 / CBS 732 / NBRC 1130 / NCYC 568 / NRRL Y-229) TaxID=559307 RepID=C5DXU4_ZYGRC|nr:uncharacterized protein ZYRO0F07854g [Zygosaccharomyces rouxii]KAH9199363.1 TIP-1 family-domain-containing protein [Zygosaccharomyces rouxii]CAR28605.1 ZYRO0F07854p [Zygosaccharomyces rouxii]